MLCPGERPVVKYAKIYVLKGKISDDEFARIKHYLINAVESRECGFDKYDTLEVKYTIPTSVETLTGFINKTDAELADFVVHYGLAMDNDDIKFCQDYFKSEHRDRSYKYAFGVLRSSRLCKSFSRTCSYYI